MYRIDIMDKLNRIEGVWINSITVTPERKVFTMFEDKDYMLDKREARDLASKDLATHIISRLLHRKFDDPSKGVTVHEFSIQNCSEMERDVFEQKIASYRETADRLDTTLNKYRTMSLWQRIRAVFKGPRW